MSVTELILLISAIFAYGAAFAAGAILSRLNIAFFTLSAGLALHLASAATRWYGIGHPPIFGTFEAALAGSWFVLLFIALSCRSVHGHFKTLVTTALPMGVFILLYGFRFETGRIPLTISEQSLWVDFHALFSWLAFGPFTLAFALSIALLWRERSGAAEELKRRDRADGANGQSVETMDELAFSYINLGFISHTVMFALGSYYSSILYGKWWEWDPAESTSLIAWLLIALYIHMRLFFNWRRARAARLYLVVFLSILFSYWGLIYLPAGSSFHVFDLGFKLHD